ncbi:MAG TPA: PASTA domain-containing protein, partial [Pyrinomonadaceae bacterium]
WLDDKVNSLFRVDAQQTTIPDVKGKLLEEARQTLINAQLKVGEVTEAAASSDLVGKVMAQAPEPGITVDCGSKVDLTVGIAGPTDPTPNPEEDTIPHNGQPKVDDPVAPDAETVETSHG